MDVERYFQKSELIPAVVQEAGTGEVLMLAYMNRESLEKTFETGYTWFYSRSDVYKRQYQNGSSRGAQDESFPLLKHITPDYFFSGDSAYLPVFSIPYGGGRLQ